MSREPIGPVEQRRREMREAKWAKHHSADRTKVTVDKRTKVTPTAERTSVTPSGLDKSEAGWEAKVALLEAEIKFLKKELAKTNKEISPGAMRMRRLRAKRQEESGND